MNTLCRCHSTLRGPGWVYQALDPHGRDYAVLVLTAAVASAVVLQRTRYAVGTALACRARRPAGGRRLGARQVPHRAGPQEVLSTQVALSHDRTWADIGSDPSGHLLVTTAMAAAAAAAVRALRGPLLAYVGALWPHPPVVWCPCPIDVLVGAAFGHTGRAVHHSPAHERPTPTPAPSGTGRPPRIATGDGDTEMTRPRAAQLNPGSDPRRVHGCDGRTIRSTSAGSANYRPH